MCGEILRTSICGEVSPHSSLWSYAPHTRTDFSYTRKVSKSVCKGQPLAKPRGGNTSRLVCLRHTQPCFPAVTFGHAPLLHLGSFLRQQGGTCPLGHCGGSRHREAVTFPPEEIFKRTPPLENAFGYFYRFIKVAAGAGCVTPQERGMGNPPHKKTSPHLTVWAGLSLDCLSNNQTTLS